MLLLIAEENLHLLSVELAVQVSCKDVLRVIKELCALFKVSAQLNVDAKVVCWHLESLTFRVLDSLEDITVLIIHFLVVDFVIVLVQLSQVSWCHLLCSDEADLEVAVVRKSNNQSFLPVKGRCVQENRDYFHLYCPGEFNIFVDEDEALEAPQHEHEAHGGETSFGDLLSQCVVYQLRLIFLGCSIEVVSHNLETVCQEARRVEMVASLISDYSAMFREHKD